MTAPPLMHGFLRAQFVYLFRTFPLRRSWRHKLWILAEAAQLLVRYGLLRISLRFAGGSGAIDDDIFFTPGQWKNFFELLLSDDQCPHGIIGQVYRPGTTSSNGSPFHHVIGRDAEVDVLIGAYAFTSEHLKRVFEVAAKIGI